MKTVFKISKIGLLIFFGMLIGFMLAETPVEPEIRELEKIVEVEKPVEIEKQIEVEKIVTEYKTPEECIELVELDNNIILKVADYFEKTGKSALGGDIIEYLEITSSEAQKLTKYVTDNTPRRLELLDKCK
jgi:hypothetical protein